MAKDTITLSVAWWFKPVGYYLVVKTFIRTLFGADPEIERHRAKDELLDLFTKAITVK